MIQKRTLTDEEVALLKHNEWITIIYNDAKRVTCRFLGLDAGVIQFGAIGWDDAIDLNQVTVERMAQDK